MPRIVIASPIIAFVALLLLPLLAEAQEVPANSVRVEVSCATQPETVTVTNTLSSTIVLQTITSLSEPRPGDEPFVLNASIPSNHVLTLHFGQGAPPDTGLVTGFPIFEEGVSSEGVQAFTSVGSFTVRCSEGSVTRTSAAGPAVTPPSTGSGGLVAGSPRLVGDTPAVLLAFVFGGLALLTFRRRGFRF
jgi:hypothetical protein